MIDQNGCTIMVFSIRVTLGEMVVVVKDVDVVELVSEVVVLVVVVFMAKFDNDDARIRFFITDNLLLKGEIMKFSKFFNATE